MDNNSIVSAAQKAWAILAKENITAQLVGTAGLLLHGWDYQPSDVDFLCESMPDAGQSLRSDPAYGDGASREIDIDGVHVNFIQANDARVPFLAPESLVILGVPVAPLGYILGLKKRAGRPKDVKFFIDHPEMDI